MDAPGHLLALKVMRMSRPGIASSWQPFFTSSPSFSAHATESILSLQGDKPLPEHPKTLRDFTHASELLTLPSAFGAIQLGETFTSCLCVNNEAKVEVEGVSLRVEIQTANNKVLLAEVGGPDQLLAPSSVLESLVSHEMKELGQHVLACHVSYRLPPSVRHPPSGGADARDPSIQSFRKYYKFVVTNPLSVKTKVHTARSPTAFLSLIEREKVFLEIHVQNMTQERMWFERIRFDAVDTWDVADGNVLHLTGQSIFSGSLAILHPQDTRQYVYILTPKSIPAFPAPHLPGTMIPLGRLDLSWRSSFGEPGRLLTSLLTRKIPMPPPKLPASHASALPPHLQLSRPRSPQHVSSRPSTPPGSTTGSKPRPPSQITRPQSPASLTSSSATLPALPDLVADLIIESFPGPEVRLETPFTVKFKLTLSGWLSGSSKVRILHLAIQHLQPLRIPPMPETVNSLTVVPTTKNRASIDVTASKPYVARSMSLRQETEAPINSASPTMSPKRGVFNFGNNLTHVLTESPIVEHNPRDSVQSLTSTRPLTNVMHLPSTFSPIVSQRNILPLGASVFFLPPLRLTLDPTPDAVQNTRREVSEMFECTMLPIRKGFTSIGGLRVLLIEDREVDVDALAEEESLLLAAPSMAAARLLREWDVVGEVWVTDQV